MYTIDPYNSSMEKLDNIKKVLHQSIATNNYIMAEEFVATLRDYKDCFYCMSYRTILMGNEKGCCDTCPIHIVGEQTVGRKVPYNGCYKTVFYREMVRLSWFYKEAPSKQTAEALIEAIECTQAHMRRYKDFINKLIVRDI